MADKSLGSKPFLIVPQNIQFLYLREKLEIWLRHFYGNKWTE